MTENGKTSTKYWKSPPNAGPFQTYSVFHNDQMRIIFGFTNFNIIQSVTSAHIQISLFRLNYLNIFINRINNLGVNGHRYSRSWENKSLPMNERCWKLSISTTQWHKLTVHRHKTKDRLPVWGYHTAIRYFIQANYNYMLTTTLVCTEA